MWLTTENAGIYKGKKLDSKIRKFHYYPLEVKQRQDGTFYYKDAVGVCIATPGIEDRRNTVYFDFVLEENGQIGL